MSLIVNKEVVSRFVNEGWNQGQLNIIKEILDPDFMGHNPAGRTFNRDQFLEAVIQLRQTFPDYHLSIEDIIAEDIKVVWRWHMQGTDIGGFSGNAPTGIQVQMQGINIEHVLNGKIIESWSSSDHTPMLKALGVFPEEE